MGKKHKEKELLRREKELLQKERELQRIYERKLSEYREKELQMVKLAEKCVLDILRTTDI